MNKFMISAVAISSAALLAFPAAAAPWRSINSRQAVLEQRIQYGIHSGRLNRTEAARLRAKFRSIVRLEASYRRSGGRLTATERRDLDRKLNQLSYHITYQSYDRQYRRR